MLNQVLTLALAAISTEAIKLHSQVDHPTAGGEGTGTPLEELTELSIELPLFDNELAQVDHPIAGGDGTGTPQEELTELSIELPLFDNELAQVERVYRCGPEL